MKYYYGLFFALIAFSMAAQEDPFKNFQGIRSSGPIPTDFSTSWADKYYENPVDIELSDEQLEGVSLEEFWINQNHAIDVLLSSGKFSFGDPVTNYINKVAAKVLASRPELRGQLRFYLYRDPSANAFCVADGLIGIHNGLIANLNSEAELAFVIAHEASHYLENHIFEDYFKREEEKNNVYVVERVEKRLKRSRTQELDADSIGLAIFMESGYDLRAVRKSLVSLYESYHPVGRCVAINNPLAYNNSYSLPERFVKEFKDSILTDYDYHSLGHDHPNVAQRIERITEALGEDTINGALFLVGEEEFKLVRKWARFENIRLNLFKANFLEALYEVNCLAEQNPQNRFLDLSRMRALYGLSIFKVRERYYNVVPPPSKIPGPVKDLTYTLFNLNRYELLGASLRLAKDLMAVYPDSKELRSMQKNLHRMLYSHSFLQDPESLFTAEAEVPERTKQFFNSVLPSYSKSESPYLKDFQQDLAYRDSVENFVLEIIEEDPEVSKSDYNYFKNNFIMADYCDGLIILDPIVFVELEGADEKDRYNSLDCEEALMEDLPERLADYSFGGQILHADFFEEMGTEGYNLLCDLKFYRSEARIYQALEFTTARWDLSSELNLYYPYITTIVGLIRHDGSDYYYFNVMDIRSGRPISQSISNEGKALLPVDFVRSTKRNLKELKQ